MNGLLRNQCCQGIVLRLGEGFVLYSDDCHFVNDGTLKTSSALLISDNSGNMPKKLLKQWSI
jgi:hypothetical protein